MIITVKSRWRTFFRSFGYLYEVTSDTPGHGCFYNTIEDEMGDPTYDIHPLKLEIEDWLLANVGKRGWTTVVEEWDRSRFVCWNRPILFRRFSDVWKFYQAFHG